MSVITQTITGYAVKNDPPQVITVEVVSHENTPRPESLVGSTYKVKTPSSEHALYITINDITVQVDGVDTRRPYEIFINSKNMENFQWVLAMTRVISAVFRKGGDVGFLAKELQEVFDPRGGHFKKGGGYVPSVVAEIGIVLQKHFEAIGVLPKGG